MSNTRAIIDYTATDQGAEARAALYAEIHDRVLAKFQHIKQEISQNLISPQVEEESEQEVE